MLKWVKLVLKSAGICCALGWLVSCSGASSDSLTSSITITNVSGDIIKAAPGGAPVKIVYSVVNNSSSPATGFSPTITQYDSKDTGRYLYLTPGTGECSSNHIDPNSRCVVTYSFRAPGDAQVGTYNYNIAFNYNGKTGQNSQSLAVNLGTNSHIKVTASTQSIAASAGGKAVNVTYTITNISSSEIQSFSSIVTKTDSKDTGSYFKSTTTSEPCGANLDAGSTCTVGYTFKAPGDAQIGKYDYQVAFNYNNETKQEPQPLTVTVTADGSATVSPASATMQAHINGNVTQAYELTNTSNVQLQLQTVGFTQNGSPVTPNNLHWSPLSACQTLDANKSCTLTLHFQPTSEQQTAGQYKVLFAFHNAPTVSSDLTTKVVEDPPVTPGELTITPITVSGKLNPYPTGSDKLYAQLGVNSEPALFKLFAKGGYVCVPKSQTIKVTSGDSSTALTNVIFNFKSLSGDNACSAPANNCPAGDYEVDANDSCEVAVVAQYDASGGKAALKSYLPQQKNALNFTLTYDNVYSNDNTAKDTFGLSLSPNVLVRASLAKQNNNDVVQVQLMNPVTGTALGEPVALNISQTIGSSACDPNFYTGTASNVPAGSKPLFNVSFGSSNNMLDVQLGCATSSSPANYAVLHYSVPFSDFISTAFSIVPDSSLMYSDINFDSTASNPQPITSLISAYNIDQNKSARAATTMSVSKDLFSVPFFNYAHASISLTNTASGTSGWATNNILKCSGKGCSQYGHLFDLIGPIPSLESNGIPEYIALGMDTEPDTPVITLNIARATGFWPVPPGDSSFDTSNVFTSQNNGCESNADPTWPMAATFASDLNSTSLFYVSKLDSFLSPISVASCQSSNKSVYFDEGVLYIPRITIPLDSKRDVYTIYHDVPQLKVSDLPAASFMMNTLYLAVASYLSHDQSDTTFYYWLVNIALDKNGEPVVVNGTAYRTYLAKTSADTTSPQLTGQQEFGDEKVFAIVPLYPVTTP